MERIFSEFHKKSKFDLKTNKVSDDMLEKEDFCLIKSPIIEEADNNFSLDSVNILNEHCVDDGNKKNNNLKDTYFNR